MKKVFKTENIKFEYKLFRKKMKNISIKIDEDAKLIISIPQKYRIKDLNEILEKKSLWIKEKLDLMKSKKKKIKNGEFFLFLGEKKLLKIIIYKKKLSSINMVKDRIEIYLNKEKEKDEIYIKSKLEKFYKNEAEKIIKERLEIYSAKMNLYPKEIRIKKLKASWGICSSNGNISFNYKIVMAPISVVDYLIVHELSHLSYFNHSKDFWNLLESFIPNYKEKKNYLKLKVNELKL